MGCKITDFSPIHQTFSENLFLNTWKSRFSVVGQGHLKRLSIWKTQPPSDVLGGGLLRLEKNYFTLKVCLSRLDSILLFCISRRCRNHAASYVWRSVLDFCVWRFPQWLPRFSPTHSNPCRKDNEPPVHGG